MVDIRFTATEAEYLEAQQLYMASNRRSRWVRVALFTVLALACLCVVLTAHPTSIRDSMPTIAPLCALGLFLLLMFGLRKHFFKKRYQQERRNFTDAHLVLDDAGYHLQVPGVGGGVAEWAGMDGWMEGKSVIIIRAGLLMRLIPKSPLSAREVEEVRTLLTSKVGAVGIMKKR